MNSIGSDEWTDGRTNGWMDRWMNGRTDWNGGKRGKPKWGLNWVGIYLKETTRRIQVQDDEDEEEMKNSDAMCNQLVFVTTVEPLMSFSRCCCCWNCLFVFYCSYTVLVVVAVLVPLETMTRSEGQTILLPQLGMIVFRISQGNVWLKWYLRLFVVSKLGINGEWGKQIHITTTPPSVSVEAIILSKKGHFKRALSAFKNEQPNKCHALFIYFSTDLFVSLSLSISLLLCLLIYFILFCGQERGLNS